MNLIAFKKDSWFAKEKNLFLYILMKSAVFKETMTRLR